jgi:hypothetical protein
MEPEKQPSREELKKTTDPQQSEMDLNVLGGVFQDTVGDSKGRQDEPDQPGASQTGGVQDKNEKIDG